MAAETCASLYAKTKSSVIESFIELTPGDYVVHTNYGIGKFIGIERLIVLGLERDYICIEYAADEKSSCLSNKLTSCNDISAMKGGSASRFGWIKGLGKQKKSQQIGGGASRTAYQDLRS